MRGCRRVSRLTTARTGPAAIASGHPMRSSPAVGSARNSMSLTPLPEFVEDGDAAPDDGTAVLRRLHSPRAALEKTHAERTFQVGDGARDGRLGRAESLRGLRHAVCLYHGHGHAHIVQLEAAFDAFDLAHGRTISDLI